MIDMTISSSINVKADLDDEEDLGKEEVILCI